MSIELVAWALRQKIDDPLKVTLISLANRAKGPEGCWPKIRLIAKDTGKSERTIKRHIEGLIELGLITTERRKTYLIYRFVLTQEVPSGVTSEDPPEKCHQVSLQEVPSGVTSQRKETRKKELSSLRSESAREESRGNVITLNRKTRLTEEFDLTPQRLAYAVEHGLSEEEAHHEFEKFQHHFIGSGTVKNDWHRTLLKWFLTATERSPRQAAYGSGRPAPATVFHATQRAIARIQAARGDDGGDEMALPF